MSPKSAGIVAVLPIGTLKCCSIVGGSPGWAGARVIEPGDGIDGGVGSGVRVVTGVGIASGVGMGGTLVSGLGPGADDGPGSGAGSRTGGVVGVGEGV
jgi:hypothetical protein